MISKSNFKLWSARQGVCRYFIANNKQKTSIILGFCDARGNQGRGKFYIKLIDLDIWDVAKTFFFNNCLLLASCVICYSINHSPGTWDTSGNTQNAGWRWRVLTLRRRQLEIVIWTTTLTPMVRSIFPLQPPPPPRLSPSLRRFTGIESYFKPHGKERNRKKQLRSHVGIELAITSHTEGWSVSVSGKLPTYPTPNPTFRFKWEVSDNVDLREGQVGSFPGNLNWSQKAAHYNQLPQSFLLWGCGI